MKYKVAGLLLMAAAWFLPTAMTEAHTPTVYADCAGVHWNLQSYEHATAVISVDGSIVDSKADLSNWTGSYEWDQTKNHTWSVTIDDVETYWDKSYQGTQEACEDSTTSSSIATSTSSTEAPTTTTTIHRTTTTESPTTTNGATSTTGILPSTGNTPQSLTGLALALIGLGTLLTILGLRRKAS